MKGSIREIQVKEERMRDLLLEKNAQGLLITLKHNFAWATGGGDSHVGLITEIGNTSLLITKTESYVISNSIEAPRVKREEMNLFSHYKFEIFPWYQPEKKEQLVKEITDNNFITDVPFGDGRVVDLFPLRYPLTEEEIERIKELGKETSLSMEEVCKRISSGDTELEVAGLLSNTLLTKGIYPSVLLVASDERIFNFRHPIPTSKRISKYVMVAICALKEGIQVAITRLVHFGRVPKEIRDKHNAVVRIDATLIHNTKVGIKWSDILQRGIEAYEELGYPEEWQKHHQGGPTGYLSREFIVNPTTKGTVLNNQPVAWNPSITGTKSEDTILVQEERTELVTPVSDWPIVEVDVEGIRYKRPDILER
ncbi:MAG: M24 family metallopeptidase [bacterium]